MFDANVKRSKKRMNNIGFEDCHTKKPSPYHNVVYIYTGPCLTQRIRRRKIVVYLKQIWNWRRCFKECVQNKNFFTLRMKTLLCGWRQLAYMGYQPTRTTWQPCLYITSRVTFLWHVSFHSIDVKIFLSRLGNDFFKTQKLNFPDFAVFFKHGNLFIHYTIIIMLILREKLPIHSPKLHRYWRQM